MMQQDKQQSSVSVTTSKTADFRPFAAKMETEGMPEIATRTFAHYYAQLVEGATGYIDRNEAGIVDEVQSYDALGDEASAAGLAALARTVIIKLNGGLGATMGMQGPKSLLPVKQGLTFLDIIIRQLLHLRKQSGARLPLVLMNSFNTEEATLAALAHYPLPQDLPLTFLQHKRPKIWANTYQPVEWPEDPEKEWCPPGHGDIYAALLTSGILDSMLDQGYEYIFVSNSDNLGAILDLKILGFFASAGLPFLMEVAERTLADNKGGHLSRRPDGQLILRELAQCPPDELDEFQDIQRYHYFNTNNLWLHLPTLRRIMQDHHEMLDLPLIRNEKPVDPTQPASPLCYQLETAMGSAISQFPGAGALLVPRRRFVPVKKTNDLLVLWSDVYTLSEGYEIELSPKRQSPPPLVSLDGTYYQLIDQMAARFPHGAPSLLNADELQVQGDVYFGRNVVVDGIAKIHNRRGAPYYLDDDTRLTGSLEIDGD
jgi:UTP--glucose-1-phosphate uridylyltransferase